MNSKKPRSVFAAQVLMIGLVTVLHQFGVGMLFLPTIIAVLAMSFIMPPIARSWVSRVVISLGVYLAIVQIASVLQFLIYPKGGFRLIAILTAAIVVGLLKTPLAKREVESPKIMSGLDSGAIIGLSMFLLVFLPGVITYGSTTYITRLGGLQVVDAVAHHVYTSSFFSEQNLHYSASQYYPWGFHISLAFTEHSMLGDVNSLSWKTHVLLFFGEYLFFGIVLGYAAIILVVAITERLRGRLLKYSDSVILGTTAGVLVSVLWLLGFYQLGFLNYYYICAALLLGAVYFIEARTDAKAKNQTGVWWLTASLVIAAGACFSWPLFTLVVLLGAAVSMWSGGDSHKLWSPCFWRGYMPVIICASMVSSSIFLQLVYKPNNKDLALLPGALTDLNITLFVVPLAIIIWRYSSIENALRRRLMALVIPHMVLVAGLILFHIVSVGEIRYFAIKAAIVLQILLLAIAIALIFATYSNKPNQKIWRTIQAATLVIALVFVCSVVATGPFKEIKGLFRGVARVPVPQFYYADADIIAKLGSSNELDSFNMTVLHYDIVNKRYFAHIGTATWGNVMTSYLKDPNVFREGSDSIHCSTQQARILNGEQTYDEARLKQSVRDCIRVANNNRLPYLIVTDQASAGQLRKDFGRDAQLVY